jgi:hypothetical protein
MENGIHTTMFHLARQLEQAFSAALDQLNREVSDLRAGVVEDRLVEHALEYVGTNPHRRPLEHEPEGLEIVEDDRGSIERHGADGHVSGVDVDVLRPLEAHVLQADGDPFAASDLRGVALEELGQQLLALHIGRSPCGVLLIEEETFHHHQQQRHGEPSVHQPTAMLMNPFCGSFFHGALPALRPSLRSGSMGSIRSPFKNSARECPWKRSICARFTLSNAVRLTESDRFRHDAFNAQLVHERESSPRKGACAVTPDGTAPALCAWQRSPNKEDI